MKRFNHIKKAMRDRTSRMRRDGIRLAIAMACLGAGLTAIYGYISSASPDNDPETIAARLAEEQRLDDEARQAYRTGTILFVTFTKYCEEHSFDNQTGNTVAIDHVDCEERLARDSRAKKEAAKGKNMKGMLASFKK